MSNVCENVNRTTKMGTLIWKKKRGGRKNYKTNGNNNDDSCNLHTSSFSKRTIFLFVEKYTFEVY